MKAQNESMSLRDAAEYIDDPIDKAFAVAIIDRMNRRGWSMSFDLAFGESRIEGNNLVQSMTSGIRFFHNGQERTADDWSAAIAEVAVEVGRTGPCKS